MSAQRIVVDDNDPIIQYSGFAWSKTSGVEGGGSLIFEGSQHTIKGNGSFSFTFNGTSVDLYGTGGQIALSGGYDPLWTCTIDNQHMAGRTPTNDTSEYWPLCSSNLVSEGTHTVTLNVTGQGNGAFFFDRFVYTPNSGPINGSGNTMWLGINNSAFHFDDNWSMTSDLQISNKPGASVSLDFTGAELSWIGDIPGDFPGNASSCTYVIDGGDPVTVTLDGHTSPNATTVKDHAFFTTSRLSAGAHSINVTYNGNYDTPLTVSYVLVTNATFTAVPESSTSVSSSAQSPTSSSNNVASSGSHPIGAIAGGAVGGVFILTLVVVFILYLRRRKGTKGQDADDKAVTPFPAVSIARGENVPKSTTTATTHVFPDGGQTPPVTSASTGASLEVHKPPNRSDVEAPPPYGSH
ncbi:hypothetical protein C0991_004182 [Blastosporella zonata]|nr:hypothetical protein C0991_004182 [Blastosporella zonata]